MQDMTKGALIGMAMTFIFMIGGMDKAHKSSAPTSAYYRDINGDKTNELITVNRFKEETVLFQYGSLNLAPRFYSLDKIREDISNRTQRVSQLTLYNELQNYQLNTNISDRKGE